VFNLQASYYLTLVIYGQRHDPSDNFNAPVKSAQK